MEKLNPHDDAKSRIIFLDQCAWSDMTLTFFERQKVNEDLKDFLIPSPNTCLT